MTSKKIHPSYGITLYRRMKIGVKFWMNSKRIPSGIHWSVQLVMAVRLLEIPPDIDGVVVECGTWKGGAAANLSLICSLVGRKLIVCDSFEGLPKGKPGDREADHYAEGEYCGTLQEVKTIISRFGNIEHVEFLQGWFQDTLPTLKQKIVLALLDVDLESSLHDAVKNLWPLLVEGGYLFIDEAVGVQYCALFFSERWWDIYLKEKPQD